MVLVPSPANPTGRAIHLCYEHCREPTEPVPLPVSDAQSRHNDVPGEPKSEFGGGFDFGYNPFFDEDYYFPRSCKEEDEEVKEIEEIFEGEVVAKRT